MKTPLIPLLLLLACSDSGDDSGQTLCDSAPVITWDYWGQGFLKESCQPCHASGTLDRNGAPIRVSFDTEADVRNHRDAILASATGESPSMPPRGGIDAGDRYLLEVWLTCWLEES